MTSFEVKQIPYKKEKTKIDFNFLVHSCGTIASLIGSAGCPHDSNWSYIYQCSACKDIAVWDYRVEQNSHEILEGAGYKQVK